MIDFDEITRRAQAAKGHALQALHDSAGQCEVLAARLDEPEGASEQAPGPDAAAEAAAREALAAETAQAVANAQRQVQILGQMFDADTMAQMAMGQQQLQQMVDQAVAGAAAQSPEAQLLQQLYGEEMGVLSAALEMLQDDEDTDWEDDGDDALTPQREDELYALLEETMARIEALPEPQPVPYEKDDPRWQRYGILLSGIVSTLNDHSLEGMDVEEHIPVFEQKIVSLVRRSWGIDGREDLLDMIRYLSQEGYALRYALYAEAASPDELLDGDEDDDDREAIARAWRFVQRYKGQYAPGFLTGWDVGRAAMLARWGCYLGWITEGEAIGILWELAQRAAQELESWREFAQSYLFGGLMWKLLCGDSRPEGYLGYLADAATGLIVGRSDGTGGEWSNCPWPARRRIGFAP